MIVMAIYVFDCAFLPFPSSEARLQPELVVRKEEEDGVKEVKEVKEEEGVREEEEFDEVDEMDEV